MKEMGDGIFTEYSTIGMCWGTNENADILLRSLGYPGWSENNCKNLFLDLISPNCSLSRSKGFLQIKVDINVVDTCQAGLSYPSHFL